MADHQLLFPASTGELRSSKLVEREARGRQRVGTLRPRSVRRTRQAEVTDEDAVL